MHREQSSSIRRKPTAEEIKAAETLQTLQRREINKDIKTAHQLAYFNDDDDNDNQLAQQLTHILVQETKSPANFIKVFNALIDTDIARNSDITIKMLPYIVYHVDIRQIKLHDLLEHYYKACEGYWKDEKSKFNEDAPLGVMTQSKFETLIHLARSAKAEVLQKQIILFFLPKLQGILDLYILYIILQIDILLPNFYVALDLNEGLFDKEKFAELVQSCTKSIGALQSEVGLSDKESNRLIDAIALKTSRISQPFCTMGSGLLNPADPKDFFFMAYHLANILLRRVLEHSSEACRLVQIKKMGTPEDVFTAANRYYCSTHEKLFEAKLFQGRVLDFKDVKETSTPGFFDPKITSERNLTIDFKESQISSVFHENFLVKLMNIDKRAAMDTKSSFVVSKGPSQQIKTYLEQLKQSYTYATQFSNRFAQHDKRKQAKIWFHTKESRTALIELQTYYWAFGHTIGSEPPPTFVKAIVEITLLILKAQKHSTDDLFNYRKPLFSLILAINCFGDFIDVESVNQLIQLLLQKLTTNPKSLKNIEWLNLFKTTQATYIIAIKQIMSCLLKLTKICPHHIPSVVETLLNILADNALREEKSLKGQNYQSKYLPYFDNPYWREKLFPIFVSALRDLACFVSHKQFIDVCQLLLTRAQKNPALRPVVMPLLYLLNPDLLSYQTRATYDKAQQDALEEAIEPPEDEEEDLEDSRRTPDLLEKKQETTKAATGVMGLVPQTPAQPKALSLAPSLSPADPEMEALQRDFRSAFGSSGSESSGSDESFMEDSKRVEEGTLEETADSGVEFVPLSPSTSPAVPTMEGIVTPPAMAHKSGGLKNASKVHGGTIFHQPSVVTTVGKLPPLPTQQKSPSPFDLT